MPRWYQSYGSPAGALTRISCHVPSPRPHARGYDGAVANIITELGSDVFAIDTQMGGYTGITSGYLIRSSKPALIETGTALSAPVVVDALTKLGVGPDDLATIVVTHIHLDHAGGVGTLANAFPNATVVVHERGARHLVDPSKLVASARRVFGPAMDRLFGELLPTDASRVVALGDVGTIDLGDGRMMEAFHAPGHASHHVGLIDTYTGDLYTGDAAGVYVPDTADVRPATPPPDFDLDLAIASIEKMRIAAPTRLLFSHFGPVDEVQSTLDRSVEELRLWVEIVREAYDAQLDLDHAVAMVKERTAERYAAFNADPDRIEKFEELSSVAANVSGIQRWLASTEQ